MPKMTSESRKKSETRMEVQRRLEEEGLAPVCPECKEGPMDVKVNTKNGHRFWGCNKYPLCNGTVKTIEDDTKSRIAEICLELEYDGDSKELFIQ